jgi:hypothetical protein
MCQLANMTMIVISSQYSVRNTQYEINEKPIFRRSLVKEN